MALLLLMILSLLNYNKSDYQLLFVRGGGCEDYNHGNKKGRKKEDKYYYNEGGTWFPSIHFVDEEDD